MKVSNLVLNTEVLVQAKKFIRDISFEKKFQYFQEDKIRRNHSILAVS